MNEIEEEEVRKRSGAGADIEIQKPKAKRRLCSDRKGCGFETDEIQRSSFFLNESDPNNSKNKPERTLEQTSKITRSEQRALRDLEVLGRCGHGRRSRTMFASVYL
jgi:hypothetical protein